MPLLDVLCIHAYFGQLAMERYVIIICSVCINICIKNVQSLFNDKLSTTTDVQLYLWNQVKDDITQLANAVGHSIDEAALLVHLVLRKINQLGHSVQLSQTGIPHMKLLKL